MAAWTSGELPNPDKKRKKKDKDNEDKKSKKSKTSKKSKKQGNKHGSSNDRKFSKVDILVHLCCKVTVY